MANKIHKLIIWLFFAPALLFAKDMKPWYLKLLLVLIAPSTYYALFALMFMVVLIIGTPDNTELHFKVEHKYKNAYDITAVTGSYIPECDTLGAEFYDCGIDYVIEEKFRIKDGLKEQDRKILSEESERLSEWTETDSTYVYNDHENIINGKSRQDYDTFDIVINKNKGTITVTYGTT